MIQIFKFLKEFLIILLTFQVAKILKICFYFAPCCPPGRCRYCATLLSTSSLVFGCNPPCPPTAGTATWYNPSSLVKMVTPFRAWPGRGLPVGRGVLQCRRPTLRYTARPSPAGERYNVARIMKPLGSWAPAPRCRQCTWALLRASALLAATARLQPLVELHWRVLR